MTYSPRSRSFTGRYGFVLLVDEAITKQAQKLNNRFRFRNEIILKKQLVHVSLYHAQFLKLPENRVSTFLDRALHMLMPPVHLNQLEIFRDKFLFWNVNNVAELYPLHELALEFSAHVDLTKTAASFQEGLKLSYREKENVKRYGYPLVKKLWKPHATLGYFREGRPVMSESVPMQGKITGVAFVEIGDNGVITSIVDQRFID